MKMRTFGKKLAFIITAAVTAATSLVFAADLPWRNPDVSEYDWVRRDEGDWREKLNVEEGKEVPWQAGAFVRMLTMSASFAVREGDVDFRFDLPLSVYRAEAARNDEGFVYRMYSAGGVWIVEARRPSKVEMAIVDGYESLTESSFKDLMEKSTTASLKEDVTGGTFDKPGAFYATWDRIGNDSDSGIYVTTANFRWENPNTWYHFGAAAVAGENETALLSELSDYVVPSFRRAELPPDVVRITHKDFSFRLPAGMKKVKSAKHVLAYENDSDSVAVSSLSVKELMKRYEAKEDAFGLSALFFLSASAGETLNERPLIDKSVYYNLVPSVFTKGMAENGNTIYRLITRSETDVYVVQYRTSLERTPEEELALTDMLQTYEVKNPDMKIKVQLEDVRGRSKTEAKEQAHEANGEGSHQQTGQTAE